METTAKTPIIEPVKPLDTEGELTRNLTDVKAIIPTSIPTATGLLTKLDAAEKFAVD